MSKSKTNTIDAKRAYENQIAPQLQKLLSKCKHYGFPAMVAVSVPLTEATGLTFTYMQPNRSGMVPTEFLEAQQLIEHPPQDTVTELPEAAAPSPAADEMHAAAEA